VNNPGLTVSLPDPGRCPINPKHNFLTMRRRYRYRGSRGSSVRTKVVPGKPVSVATLARREKRLVTTIGRLEQLSEDPAYLAEESLRLSRIHQIDAEIEKLIAFKKTFEQKEAADALARISAIYAHVARSFVDSRSWWQKFTDPIPDFKYSLPSTKNRRIATNFSATGGSTGKSFGCFTQSMETWASVRQIERAYLDACDSNQAEISRRLEALSSERNELKPRKIWHKTPSDLPQLKAELSTCQELLAQAMLDEERLRSIYGVDDNTIGKAAAFDEKTRKLANKLRPQLLIQLERSNSCPYCGGELGKTPNADHIVPVSLGGLSTVSNMVFVCATCNNNKANLTLREYCLKYSLNRDHIESILTLLGKRV